MRVDPPFYRDWIAAVTLENPLYDFVIGNVAGVSDDPGNPAVLLADEALAEIGESGEINSFPAMRRKHAGAVVLSSDVVICPNSVRQTAVQSPGDLTHSKKFRREVESDSSLQRVKKEALKGSTVQVRDGRAQFVRKRGVLHRLVIWKPDEQRRQLVLPSKFRGTVLQSVHHPSPGRRLGSRKTLARVQEQCFWRRMGRDVVKYVNSCDFCHENQLRETR